MLFIISITVWSLLWLVIGIVAYRRSLKAVSASDHEHLSISQHQYSKVALWLETLGYTTWWLVFCGFLGVADTNYNLEDSPNLGLLMLYRLLIVAYPPFISSWFLHGSSRMLYFKLMKLSINASIFSHMVSSMCFPGRLRRSGKIILLFTIVTPVVFSLAEKLWIQAGLSLIVSLFVLYVCSVLFSRVSWFAHASDYSVSPLDSWSCGEIVDLDDINANAHANSRFYRLDSASTVLQRAFDTLTSALGFSSTSTVNRRAVLVSGPVLIRENVNRRVKAVLQGETMINLTPVDDGSGQNMNMNVGISDLDDEDLFGVGGQSEGEGEENTNNNNKITLPSFSSSMSITLASSVMDMRQGQTYDQYIPEITEGEGEGEGDIDDNDRRDMVRLISRAPIALLRSDVLTRSLMVNVSEGEGVVEGQHACISGEALATFTVQETHAITATSLVSAALTQGHISAENLPLSKLKKACSIGSVDWIGVIGIEWLLVLLVVSTEVAFADGRLIIQRTLTILYALFYLAFTLISRRMQREETITSSVRACSLPMSDPRALLTVWQRIYRARLIPVRHSHSNSKSNDRYSHSTLWDALWPYPLFSQCAGAISRSGHLDSIQCRTVLLHGSVGQGHYGCSAGAEAGAERDGEDTEVATPHTTLSTHLKSIRIISTTISILSLSLFSTLLAYLAEGLVEYETHVLVVVLVTVTGSGVVIFASFVVGESAMYVISRWLQYRVGDILSFSYGNEAIKEREGASFVSIGMDVYPRLYGRTSTLLWKFRRILGFDGRARARDNHVSGFNVGTLAAFKWPDATVYDYCIDVGFLSFTPGTTNNDALSIVSQAGHIVLLPEQVSAVYLGPSVPYVWASVFSRGSVIIVVNGDGSAERGVGSDEEEEEEEVVVEREERGKGEWEPTIGVWSDGESESEGEGEGEGGEGQNRPHVHWVDKEDKEKEKEEEKEGKEKGKEEGKKTFVISLGSMDVHNRSVLFEKVTAWWRNGRLRLRSGPISTSTTSSSEGEGVGVWQWNVSDRNRNSDASVSSWYSAAPRVTSIVTLSAIFRSLIRQLLVSMAIALTFGIPFLGEGEGESGGSEASTGLLVLLCAVFYEIIRLAPLILYSQKEDKSKGKSGVEDIGTGSEDALHSMKELESLVDEGVIPVF